MIFDVREIIRQLSIGFTLRPGDVVMTGTPEGVGYAMQPPRTLKDGDVVECEIDGIGTLRNTVRAERLGPVPRVHERHAATLEAARVARGEQGGAMRAGCGGDQRVGHARPAGRPFVAPRPNPA